MSVTQRVLERAHELGFDLADVAPAVRLPHAERYARWLEQGFHGRMGYMENHQALRVDARALFAPTQTVIAVGMRYGAGDEGMIARYARGHDYHEVMRARLDALAAFVRVEVGGEVATRACVDSAPLLERDVALLAGLGWLGKSACVINQRLGSYLLLGELCVGADLEVSTTPHPERCGTCRRCLDACPTGAIVAPHVVDARRCISYLTIELRGAIPRGLRPLIGDHLFGCDICQSVCPWNRKAPAAGHALFEPLEAVAGLTLAQVARLSARAFRALLRGSPLFRARRSGLVRNACVVLGNLGDRDAVAVLIEVLERDGNAVARGHAAWALGRLGGAAARAGLEAALAREDDADVCEEARHALASL